MLNSAGFFKEWLLTAEESMFVPKTSPTQYEYSEDVYECHCPAEGELEEDGEYIEIQTEYYPITTFFNYSGSVKCDKSSPAMTSSEMGEPWIQAPKPDPISPVDVVLHVIYKQQQDGSYKSFAECLFENKNETQYYVVGWYADAVSTPVYTTGISKANVAGFNAVSVSNLVAAYRANPTLSQTCAINRRWRCAVTVVDATGKSLLPAVASKYEDIIKIETKYVKMNRGASAEILYTINVPILCQPGTKCGINVKVYDESDDYKCENSTLAVRHKSMCGDIVAGENNIASTTDSMNKSIKITTKNNNWFELKDTFTLTMEIEGFGKVDEFWDNCKLNTKIKVEVEDFKNYWMHNYCYSNNDPRIGTFDGAYFSLNNAGNYTLYKHKTLPIRVEIETEICNGGWAACTCGVTVNAGTDVFAINHCGGYHLIKTIQNTEKIMSVRELPGYMHTFYLPQGTMINVDYHVGTFWKTMNVQIFPSPDDMNNTEGLCGNFNNDWEDDFTHKGGAVTLPQGDRYWNWFFLFEDPDEFSESWREETPLLQLAQEGKLDDVLNPWADDSKYCVCPLVGGSRQPMCHKKEDKQCTNSKVYAGKEKILIEETKRSVDSQHMDDLAERLGMLGRMRAMNKLQRKKREAKEYTEAEIDDAKAKCEAYLKDDCMDGITILGNKTEKSTLDCARDLVLNPNASDAQQGSCRAVKTTIVTTFVKDIEAQDTYKEQFAKVKKMCIDDCNGNGKCNDKGACECDGDYDPLTNCSLSRSQKPTLQGLSGGGLKDGKCDRKAAGCNAFTIATSGCTSQSTCKANVTTHYSDETKTVTEKEQPCTCVNGFDVEYDVSAITGARRRRSIDTVPLGTTVGVAVSNDGSTYSESASNVDIILDSTCITNDGTKFVLAAGYCLIDGVCYAAAETENDGCYTCDMANRFEWTISSDYCEIGGTCYNESDAKSAAESCLTCVPSTSQTEFTQTADTCVIDNQCYDNNGFEMGIPCRYCNTDMDNTSWTMKDDTCFISGGCYDDKADNPLNGCLYCDSDESISDWQTHVNKTECLSEKDAVSGAVIAAAVIVPILVLGGIGAGILIYKKMQTKKIMDARMNGGLYDETPKNGHFRTRVTPTPYDPVIPAMPYNIPKDEINPDKLNSRPDNLYSDDQTSQSIQTPIPSPAHKLPAPTVGFTSTAQPMSSASTEMEKFQDAGHYNTMLSIADETNA
ncbi:uncharacterized protein LOC127834822 [Dreissena polymorpha]|nr:uncharacterized protein LOC127834822 [Dreissena polymorpha]